MAKHQNGPRHQVWRGWKVWISVVRRCYLQSLFWMDQMAQEELEKVSLDFFTEP